MSRLSKSSEVGLIVTSRRSSAKESSSATILPRAGHPTKSTLFSCLLEGFTMRWHGNIDSHFIASISPDDPSSEY
jgi:hypothetical protein